MSRLSFALLPGKFLIKTGAVTTYLSCIWVIEILSMIISVSQAAGKWSVSDKTAGITVSN